MKGNLGRISQNFRNMTSFPSKNVRISLQDHATMNIKVVF